ncbi:MAG: phosphoribosylaminoimidazolecarboxamide formyltransferase / cyclohydrolase, partial [Actinomycetota bacterium]|nr:phosphoribosylaminoimidazolecarboxamide formyltransferase / cyclohydrolase [Actinomycetota bacterium]
MSESIKVRRALLSVSDKTGIEDLARGLIDAGVHIISSGGTAAAIAAAGLAVEKVSDVTGAPEILGGRVKTLHPKIHGGILADRRVPGHLEELEQQGIEPIDLVVCNLYPFEATIAKEGTREDDAVEQIDIGGPAMVRAAAKNFMSVAVVVNPDRYDDVLEEIRSSGGVSETTRRSLARDAFAHTGAYDSAITRYLSQDDPFPEQLVVTGRKVMGLRYGENSHQEAAFYRTASAGGLADAEQLHGKELSYNNLLDTDAAWKLVNELEGDAAAIIKHSNPCGVALGTSISDAYAKALDCDRTSAFGGIVALRSSCDEDT